MNKTLKGKSSLTYDEYKDLLEDAIFVGITQDEVDKCLRLKGIPIPTPTPAPAPSEAEKLAVTQKENLIKVHMKLLELQIELQNAGKTDVELNRDIKEEYEKQVKTLDEWAAKGNRQGVQKTYQDAAKFLLTQIKQFKNKLKPTGGNRRTYRQQHRLPSIAKRLRTFRR